MGCFSRQSKSREKCGVYGVVVTVAVKRSIARKRNKQLILSTEKRSTSGPATIEYLGRQYFNGGLLLEKQHDTTITVMISESIPWNESSNAVKHRIVIRCRGFVHIRQIPGSKQEVEVSLTIIT